MLSFPWACPDAVLVLAATYGHDRIVGDLLNCGRCECCDKRAAEAAVAAAEHGHERVLRVMLDHGLDPDSVDAHGRAKLTARFDKIKVT